MTEQNLFRKIEKSLKDRVSFVLETYKKTRDDDNLLAVMLYKEFYKQYLKKDVKGDWYLNIEDKHNLPDDEKIKRIRRKIQADGKFMATPEVQEMRKQRQSQYLTNYGKTAENYTLDGYPRVRV